MFRLYLKQNENLSHWNLVTKCIKICYLMFHRYLKQNEYLSHPNLVSKCIGHNALREYLMSHLYLKQNEYLSHPILVSKCIGHCSLRGYLMSHLYFFLNEYLLHLNLVLIFVPLSPISNKYWTLKHFDNIYMWHNETIINNQIRVSLLVANTKHWLPSCQSFETSCQWLKSIWCNSTTCLFFSDNSHMKYATIWEII
jgi:hypothetical protein